MHNGGSWAHSMAAARYPIQHFASVLIKQSNTHTLSGRPRKETETVKVDRTLADCLRREIRVEKDPCFIFPATADIFCEFAAPLCTRFTEAPNTRSNFEPVRLAWFASAPSPAHSFCYRSSRPYTTFTSALVKQSNTVINNHPRRGIRRRNNLKTVQVLRKVDVM